jgi:hypothetical protein
MAAPPTELRDWRLETTLVKDLLAPWREELPLPL